MHEDTVNTAAANKVAINVFLAIAWRDKGAGRNRTWTSPAPARSPELHLHPA